MSAELTIVKFAVELCSSLKLSLNWPSPQRRVCSTGRITFAERCNTGPISGEFRNLSTTGGKKQAGGAHSSQISMDNQSFPKKAVWNNSSQSIIGDIPRREMA